ncbi:3-oxoacyl-[acyl-carrier-protein] synthase-3 [Paracoccus isoporae]|uniref:Beta-ketoacyl-[acyl-carrier-protein] synthase III n=1 Tax=Paracoccus isoporae TaxID=591205 RepID=A0A1G7BC57_9RHOB|nr:beta-ketoacyl-ACP synthase III [Paracoccus isoporae]SDE24497.1 3-oxoacyl-[acyl-carrier-protein] synthase-3 [Paracoccus isoporae]
MTRRAVIRGTGRYLPERVVENAWFEDKVDTSDEWIRSRTGIERRHFAAEGETTSAMAIRAAEQAMSRAGLSVDQIDAVIVATSTPDLTFPSVATMVQSGLGLTRAFAFDVQAVCAGFVFALANADAMIRAGQADRVLVIGAETFSRILDWSDRGTCVLFGDGAGAVVLEAAEGARGILSSDLNSDGSFRDILYVDGGVSTTGSAGKLRMQGNVLFRHAVEKLAQTAHRAIEKAGLTTADVDWLVPHQANARIITATAQRMSLPMEKVVLTVADHGNTSAASIPLALSVADEAGRFSEGDVIVTEAIGGGLSWGSVVVRW